MAGRPAAGAGAPSQAGAGEFSTGALCAVSPEVALMDSPKVADLLAAWLGRAAGRRFDVDVGGTPLGGKRGEMPLTPREYAVSDGGFTIRFGGGSMATIGGLPGGVTVTVRVGGTEVLEVRGPAGVSIVGAGELLVETAAEVQFGWHYYGRPQTPENWCVERFTLQGAVLRRERSGPLPPRGQGEDPVFLQYPGGPIIHLVPLD